MPSRLSPVDHVTAARALRVLVAMMALAIGGCPQDLEVPAPEGAVCTTYADCNAGATCGELLACVLEHCEREPSLLVPCDAGTPIDAN